MRHLLILFAGAMLVGSHACAHARDQIAFVRGGNIWLMAPDGSNQTRITSSGECAGPAWSPDGKFLLFISGDNVWKMQMSDRRLRRLTESGDCTAAAWRPGTQEVWYGRSPHLKAEMLSDAGQDAFIARIDATGAGYKRCFALDAFAGFWLAWHPGGRLLSVRWGDGHDDGGLRVYDTSGGQAPVPSAVTNERWTSVLIQVFSAAWSPVRPELIAMSKLYYSTPEGGIGDERGDCLVVVDTRAKRQQLIHEQLGSSMDEPALDYVECPTWSPDGKSIAYGICGPGGEHVWTATLECERPVKVASDAHDPAWRP